MLFKTACYTQLPKSIAYQLATNIFQEESQKVIFCEICVQWTVQYIYI